MLKAHADAPQCESSRRECAWCVPGECAVVHAPTIRLRVAAQMSDFERDAAVNYFGVIRVCKAFLPHLKTSAMQQVVSGRGSASPRILVVSSMSGKLPMPILSSYSSTKHAVAAFAASLRMEVQHMFGIHVCTLLPSFHRTPLLAGAIPSLDRVWKAVPAETRAAYGGEVAIAAARECAEDLVVDWAWDPARVVEGATRAITSLSAPPRELAVGGDARFGLNVMRHLPPFVYETIIYYYVCWSAMEP